MVGSRSPLQGTKIGRFSHEKSIPTYGIGLPSKISPFIASPSLSNVDPMRSVEIWLDIDKIYPNPAKYPPLFKMLCWFQLKPIVVYLNWNQLDLWLLADSSGSAALPPKVVMSILSWAQTNPDWLVDNPRNLSTILFPVSWCEMFHMTLVY